MAPVTTTAPPPVSEVRRCQIEGDVVWCHHDWPTTGVCVAEGLTRCKKCGALYGSDLALRRTERTP